MGQILVQYLYNEYEDAKDRLLFTPDLDPGYRKALMQKMEEFQFLANLPDMLYKMELAKQPIQVAWPQEKQIYQAVVEGKA